jgi:ribose transport system permease protein
MRTFMAPATTAFAGRILARASMAPGVAYLLPILILLFGLVGREFASVPNLLNIGTQSAILLLLALPMTLIIMSEGLDLSMGAVLGVCSVVLATLLVQGWPLPAAALAAVAAGALFGLLNGLFVVLAGIPAFVVTLGTMGIAQGIALVASNGASVVGLGPSLPGLYASSWLGLPFPIVLSVIAYAAFHLALYHTRFGTYVFAIGGNRESLTLAGVRANLHHVGVYVLGGAMVGLAGLLLTGRMNAGHPAAAIGLEFDAIAAVVVGGTSFERGNGWLPGAVLGVLAVGVLKNGLNILAVPSPLQVASIGLLVIVALLLDSWKGRA